MNMQYQDVGQEKVAVDKGYATHLFFTMGDQVEEAITKF
jgi:hypothetical protein